MAKHFPSSDAKKLLTFKEGVSVRFRGREYIPKKNGLTKGTLTDVTNVEYLLKTQATVTEVKGSKCNIRYPNGQELYNVPLKSLGIWHEQLNLKL